MSKIRKKLDKIITNKTKELEKVGLEIEAAKWYNNGIYKQREYVDENLKPVETIRRAADFADIKYIPYDKKHDVYKSFFDEVVDLVGGRIEYITISSVGKEVE